MELWVDDPSGFSKPLKGSRRARQAERCPVCCEMQKCRFINLLNVNHACHSLHLALPQVGHKSPGKSHLCFLSDRHSPDNIPRPVRAIGNDSQGPPPPPRPRHPHRHPTGLRPGPHAQQIVAHESPWTTKLYDRISELPLPLATSRTTRNPIASFRQSGRLETPGKRGERPMEGISRSAAKHPPLRPGRQ